MSLIISTGSNIGERKLHLEKAKNILSENFKLIFASRIYESPAVDYREQPDFLNQVLEFQIPNIPSTEVMQLILDIEKKLGRVRNISKGPRTIDIDILFWGLVMVNTPLLTIPHPSWAQRNFIVSPLKELPFFCVIEKNFSIPTDFDHTCYPLEN